MKTIILMMIFLLSGCYNYVEIDTTILQKHESQCDSNDGVAFSTVQAFSDFNPPTFITVTCINGAKFPKRWDAYDE